MSPTRPGAGMGSTYTSPSLLGREGNARLSDSFLFPSIEERQYKEKFEAYERARKNDSNIKIQR